MSEPENVPKHQRVFALISKAIALLGLAALSFLLARPATTLPIGWIVFTVAVIRLSLAYSPTRRSVANRQPLSLPLTECRAYRYRTNNPYQCRNLNRKENYEPRKG